MSRFYSAKTRLNVLTNPVFEKFNVVYYFTGNDVKCGTNVEIYSNEQDANSAAKQFFEMAELALLEGYRLEKGSFKNNQGKDIHFSHALDKDQTLDKFKVLLTE